MTVTMGLAVTAPKAAPRGTERGGKDAAEGGQRFDEALAARQGRAGPRGETIRNRPAVEPVGFDPRFEPMPDEPSIADPQAVREAADETGAADLPMTEIEAALLALQVRSDVPRQQDAAKAMAAESGDALMQRDAAAAESGGADDAPPARDARSGERNAPPHAPLPATRDAPLPPDPRLGERNASLLRHVRFGEAAALPLREAGIRENGFSLLRAAGGPAAASRAASRTSVQTRAGDAQAAPAPAPGEARPAAATPGEARPVEGPARAMAMQAGPQRPAFDMAGNLAAAGNRMTARLEPSDTSAGRVNVLGFSTALPPAPAVAPLPAATVAGLVLAMDADPSWRAAAAETTAPPGQRAPGFTNAVSTLRIQLNPAELGMVTARLTASGSQLSIEIQTESNDARQRLAADSEIIVKALRAIGYDVDKVTIQQAPQGGGQQQGQASGRDPFAANQQAQEEGSARGRDRSGGNAGQQQGSGHGGGEAAADRAGGGLYI